MNLTRGIKFGCWSEMLLKKQLNNVVSIWAMKLPRVPEQESFDK